MKKSFGMFLVLFLAAVISLSSSAQSTRGTVTGVVRDSAGALLTGADVTLYSPATGVSATVKTNASGIYSFEAVTVGDYTVSAASEGFSKKEATATVTVGALVGRDFELSVGAVSIVEVSANVSGELQTEDAVRSQVIAASALAELPIAGQNSLNLILTAPGVVRSN